MYTTTNESGILNNYATEPKVSYAEYPSQAQQSRYAFQAAKLGERASAIATLFVSFLVFTAIAVS